MFIPDRELIPLIRDALERGQRVRLTATGSSMAPFVYNGEVVELEVIKSLPRLGDIVQVQCSGKRCILHRVVRFEGEMFFLRGDAQTHHDGPFTRHDLLGKLVVSVNRKGRVRVHDRGAWRLAGLLWIWIMPLGPLLLGLVRRIRGISRVHLLR